MNATEYAAYKLARERLAEAYALIRSLVPQDESPAGTTTAIEELEKAASAAEASAASYAGFVGSNFAEIRRGFLADAERLRQRAALFREMHRQRAVGGDIWMSTNVTMLERLTGPIPNETAPAIAAAIDKTFEQDAGLLRRLADSPRPTPVQEAARMWREGETAPAASVGLVVPVCAAGCGRPVKGGDGTEALYCDEHAPAAPKEGTGP